MSEVIYEGQLGQVLFEENVVETLNSWRQMGNALEAGGILIGYRRPPHLHVIACTMPMKRDRRSRYHFHRKDLSHKKAAVEYWDKEHGRAYYLGEWHTHPEQLPSPSLLDRLEWKRLMWSKLGPDLLFLIVGRSHWYLQRQSEKITKQDRPA
jgi:integrative and conjugative element protein (TIGR02256 family)